LANRSRQKTPQWLIQSTSGAKPSGLVRQQGALRRQLDHDNLVEPDDPFEYGSRLVGSVSRRWTVSDGRGFGHGRQVTTAPLPAANSTKTIAHGLRGGDRVHQRSPPLPDPEPSDAARASEGFGLRSPDVVRR